MAERIRPELARQVLDTLADDIALDAPAAGTGPVGDRFLAIRTATYPPHPHPRVKQAPQAFAVGPQFCRVIRGEFAGKLGFGEILHEAENPQKGLFDEISPKSVARLGLEPGILQLRDYEPDEQ